MRRVKTAQNDEAAAPPASASASKIFLCFRWRKSEQDRSFTTFTRVYVVPKYEMHLKFHLDFLAQDPLKEQKSPPLIWCPILGLNGVRLTYHVCVWIQHFTAQKAES